MADSDWIYIADSPSGGIYRHKDTGEWVVGDTSYGKSLPSQFLQYVLGGGDTGGGNTYTTKVDSDGSVTGVPGATYQLGSNGSVSIVSRPSSGGGGSTTINYNTQAANDLGPNRYQFVTSDGSDGLPPGSTYQLDKLDGSKSNIKLATAGTNDSNGDGFDDKSGLPTANGVTATMIGGKLYFQGKEINPDGSLKGSTSGGKPDAPTWTGYGPKGQGTYYLDGPNGTPGTFIGATTAGASSSGGGSYISASTVPRVSSGGSSGGSSYDPSHDQAAAAMQAASLAVQQAENAKDRAQAEAHFQAQFGLSTAQFEESRRKAAADEKANALDKFGSAVSDVDPAQLSAWLYANGFPAGGTIANRIAEGGNAISANALVRAAGYLDTIRGGNGSVGGLGNYNPAAGGLPPTGAPSGGTPPAPATPVLPSSAPATGPRNPGLPPGWEEQVQKEQDKIRAENLAKDQAWHDPANWEPRTIDQTTGSKLYVNKTTGETINAFQYGDLVNQFRGQPDEPSTLTGSFPGAYGGQNAGLWIKPVIYDALGQASGTSSQNVIPGASGYNGDVSGFGGYLGPNGWVDTAPLPAKPVMNLTGDNISRPMPSGQAGGPTGEPTTIQPRAVLPGYAKGGLAQGTFIVGENGPEVVHAPAPTSVRPISPGLAQSLLGNGTPGYALGTDDLQYAEGMTPVGYFGGRKSPYGQTSTTRTAAPAQPAPTPTPTPAPTPVAPTQSTQPTTGLGNSPSVPSTQPVAQPTQPPPQNAQGQTIQPPAVPAPVTGGLGSITDIVNSGSTTPTSQALLDELYKWRTDQEVYNVNPLSLDFQNLDPYTQQAILMQRQTKYGVPVAAQQAEIAKYRIPGASRGSLAGSLSW